MCPTTAEGPNDNASGTWSGAPGRTAGALGAGRRAPEPQLLLQTTARTTPPEQGAVAKTRSRREPGRPALRGLIGVSSQPFAEIVNQLATVERLLDSLVWAGRIGGVDVIECNPSTSRGPAASCSHDVVVRCSDVIVVVEVSDVAGVNGNANQKMEKDLATLDRCTCEGAAVRRILAVSPQSASWLQARLGRESVVEAGVGEGTWIVERT